MMCEILNSKNFSGIKTSIVGSFKVINRVLCRKSVVFLISDFQDENYEKDLVEMEYFETKETIAVDISAVCGSFKQKMKLLEKKPSEYLKSFEIYFAYFGYHCSCKISGRKNF